MCLCAGTGKWAISHNQLHVQCMSHRNAAMTVYMYMYIHATGIHSYKRIKAHPLCLSGIVVNIKWPSTRSHSFLPPIREAIVTLLLCGVWACDGRALCGGCCGWASWPIGWDRSH